MAGTLGITRFQSLEERLARLDEFRRESPRRVGGLAQELETLRSDLSLLKQDVATAAGAELVESAQRRIAELEGHLARAEEQLTHLASERANFGPEVLESRLGELEAEVDGRWRGLSHAVAAAAVMAEETRGAVDRLNADIRPDESVRWREIVGPTVQLAGDTTVGSGVLLATHADLEEEPLVWLLTSWHVVRDIRADAWEDDPKIPVRVYLENGEILSESAELVRYDADLDAALLSLVSEVPAPNTARLAHRSSVESTHTFQEIYAVGCPLGNDPIPTAGEVASTHHEVDGSVYWMISAPTYIGNSGGGIYDSRTHALLGIFSKIYTHGSLRPTIVPHMGLVTPISQIYDWLEGEGFEVVEGEHGLALARALDE